MRQPEIHTERLLIRELRETDLDGMFEMESNPNVHLYLEEKPLTKKDEVVKIIKYVRQQYQDHGIGRWAVEEKATGEFVGWTGFKMNTEPLNDHTNFIDLGYRFKESAWGKGYAGETALASMKYAFEQLAYDRIYGAADVNNIGSNKILQKVGLELVNSFNLDGVDHHWYAISREDWIRKFQNKDINISY